MAKTEKTAKQSKSSNNGEGAAKFPYTSKPSSLRRILQLIPQKPKPPKVSQELLRGWGFGDNNDLTVIRVLKAVGLLSPTNEPTDLYSRFMNLQGGAAALAEPIRAVYQPLFSASHQPARESPEVLKNLFNIHSGGGERSLELQIQTFKALCESTSFEGTSPAPASVTSAAPIAGTVVTPASVNGGGTPLGAALNINLHIHLPENKTRRDYEAIIEDIGRYIFGVGDRSRPNE